MRAFFDIINVIKFSIIKYLLLRKETKMNINILRVIALLDIILIHTLKSQPNFNLLNFMFTFVSIGINLFIIISGYLLLDKDEDIIVFYKKRVVSILPLFIMWSFIYIIYYKENPFYVLSGYRYAAGHLWYIPMILGLYLITPWLRKVLKYCEKETLVIVLLWFIINVLNPMLIFFKLPFLNLSSFPIVGFLGYYLLVYYIKKYSSQLKVKYFYIIYMLGFLFTYFISYYFMNYVGKKNVFFYDKNSISVFFMSISFFIIILKVDFSYLTSKAKKVLNFLSKYSYHVYLAHLLFYEIGLKITKNFYLVTIFCVCSSYLFSYLFDCIIKIAVKIFTIFQSKKNLV